MAKRLLDGGDDVLVVFVAGLGGYTPLWRQQLSKDADGDSPVLWVSIVQLILQLSSLYSINLIVPNACRTTMYFV
jgi:hypothetical protein